MGFLYTYFIAPILWILFKIGALFFSEFKKRENVISSFRQNNIHLQSHQKVLWVHSASMGEFEQAKPIIEHIRETEKEHLFIVVTFFSPSGYEHQKNYPHADYVTYLPIDTNRGMEEFVDKIQPSIVVFVRYEIWPNLLSVLAKRTIPFLFVNATYPNSWLWDSIGKSYLKKLLSKTEGIYAVNEQMYLKFKQLLPIEKVHLSADTRIDRIIEKVRTHQAEYWYEIPPKPTLIVGSSWEAEENLLASISSSLLDKFHIIIVPHKPEIETIQRLQSLFQNTILLSQCSQKKESQNEVVIVDSVGKLLSLYRIATVAFVGGGFGRCVHSTAEAIAFGIPTFCGPNIHSSPDASFFEKEGILSIVRTKEDVEAILQKVLNDNNWLQFIRNRSEAILLPSIGESKRIGEIVRNYLR